MTFGEKLRRMRGEYNLTQEALAEKIFVTRTAISKWETNKGYPSIDSLKAISNLFGVSLDELISDDDVANKKMLDDKFAKRFYLFAVVFLGISVVFALLAYFLAQPYFSIGSICGAVGYVVCGIFSKPKYKRLQLKKLIVPYVLSRIVLFLIVLGVIISTIITL